MSLRHRLRVMSDSEHTDGAGITGSCSTPIDKTPSSSSEIFGSKESGAEHKWILYLLDDLVRYADDRGLSQISTALKASQREVRDRIGDPSSLICDQRAQVANDNSEPPYPA